ncbi:hypothetical protein ANCDUO_08052 [Ancylostoma duodenale]|uniref:Uncharacterized protein n=1 Tax=Ancylostoma duodenale TaxID=51022 RepID=A0A0C2GRC2_9BILA|nr:hypothetical protein ANCDUO_08052 [Ancylostoma duodenale]
MDITTSLILGICLWLIKNTNYFKYPRGRSSRQPRGLWMDTAQRTIETEETLVNMFVTRSFQ